MNGEAGCGRERSRRAGRSPRGGAVALRRRRAAAGTPGRARAVAGAARCHLAAAVATAAAAGGAGGAGEAIKVSRRGTCTLRGNFLAGAAAMGGVRAPASPAPP